MWTFFLMLTFGLFLLFDIFFMASLTKYTLMLKINALLYRMTILICWYSFIHLWIILSDNSETFYRKNSAKQSMSSAVCALNCKVHVIIPFKCWLQNYGEGSTSKIIESGTILFASTKSHASGSLPLAC